MVLVGGVAHHLMDAGGVEIAQQPADDVWMVQAGVAGILHKHHSTGTLCQTIRQIAGGYRMATKPEQHDVVVAFAKSLKPPVRLSLQALETLAVIAYKQPVTAPEIGEIRGVDSSGVLVTPGFGRWPSRVPDLVTRSPVTANVPLFARAPRRVVARRFPAKILVGGLPVSKKCRIL